MTRALADSNSEVDQVCVDQFLQQPRATRLILKGQLGQGTLSLESIPSDKFNQRPATSLNFQAQGGLLLVRAPLNLIILRVARARLG
ncbi:MAG: hypothetical protein U0931_08275 [Vulcanimicrobiota bacterium]